MPRQKHLRFLLCLVYIALGVAALVWLLPGLLPFLLALALAALLEPPVRLLADKAKLRRPLAAAAVMLIFALLLGTGCFLLARRLWYELVLLLERLPALLDSFDSVGRWAERTVYRLTVAAAPSARELLENMLESVTARAQGMAAELAGRVLSWAASALTALPTAGLFLITTLLATYFISAGRPALAIFFRRQVPERWLPRLEEARGRLRGALGAWLRAQCVLMAVTFAMLGVGFLLLGVDLALLLAAGVALLDALPVFGTGTVLLPWALGSALSGHFSRCAGLLALYALIWLTRSILEPKLIADRVGLPPLAALLAMYLGFTLFGVAGLLLAPLAAVILRQLHDSGAFPVWK